MNKKLTLLVIFCMACSICPINAALIEFSNDNWIGKLINGAIDWSNKVADGGFVWKDEVKEKPVLPDIATKNQTEIDESAINQKIGERQTATEDMMNSINYLRTSTKQSLKETSYTGNQKGGVIIKKIETADRIFGYSVFPVKIVLTTPKISTDLDDVKKRTVEYDGKSYSLDIKGYTEIEKVTFRVMQGETVISHFVLDDLEIESESKTHTFEGILKTPDSNFQKVQTLVQGGLIDISEINEILMSKPENFEIEIEVRHTMCIFEENEEHALWGAMEHEEGAEKPKKYPDTPTYSKSYTSKYLTEDVYKRVKKGEHDINGYESGLGLEYGDIFGTDIFPFKTESNGAVNNMLVPLYASMIHQYENPATFNFKIVNYPENLLPYSDNSKLTNMRYRLVAVNYKTDKTCSLSFDSKDNLPLISGTGTVNKVLPYTTDSNTADIVTYLIVTGRVFDENSNNSYPVWYIAKPKIVVRSNYQSVIRNTNLEIDELIKNGEITANEAKRIKELFEGNIDDLNKKIEVAKSWEEKNKQIGNKKGQKYANTAISRYQDAINVLKNSIPSDIDSVREAKNKAYLYETEANDYLEASRKSYYGADDSADSLVSNYEKKNNVPYGLFDISGYFDSINTYIASKIPSLSKLNESVPGGILTILAGLSILIIVLKPSGNYRPRRRY